MLKPCKCPRRVCPFRIGLSSRSCALSPWNILPGKFFGIPDTQDLVAVVRQVGYANDVTLEGPLVFALRHQSLSN